MEKLYANIQPLGHPQAYKPYSPRIPKDDEIPLHQTSTSQAISPTQGTFGAHQAYTGAHVTRPSSDEPHTSLLPAHPPASVAPTLSHNVFTQKASHTSSSYPAAMYTNEQTGGKGYETEFSEVPMDQGRVGYDHRADDETVRV